MMERLFGFIGLLLIGVATAIAILGSVLAFLLVMKYLFT